MQWLGKPCQAIWDVDVLEYQKENIPASIRGGFLLMVFPDNLPENIWLKRMIYRLTKARDHIKFPVAAINISERTLFDIDNELQQQVEQNLFAEELISGYINRSHNIFEFGKYFARAGLPDADSQLRLLSVADLSQIQKQRREMLIMLSLACAAIIVISSLIALFMNIGSLTGVSLRQRIAAIFMIAIMMPIISLVSIGNTFIAHEETRMKESVFVKMRAGMEALDLRYKDTPRLVERQLFQDLLQLIGSSPYDLDRVQAAMEKASEQELIENFVISDFNGKVIRTNWPNFDLAMKKMLEMAAMKMIKFEKGIYEGSRSVLQEAVDEEISELMDSLGNNLDFSRPSHLRYFAYVDQHMYFMSINVMIDEKPYPLFVHLPESFLEKHFATREFSLNRLASEQSEGDNSIARPELSFYSTFAAAPSIPKESDLWGLLEDSFKRSFSLKVEEHGEVKIGNENFLFLIKPITSMYRQSFVPCLISSTALIDERLRSAKIVVVGLAMAAILGAGLLSLALASSLLVPISRIDAAAQQVGKGNLNIILPEMGTDELGRLSQTMNDMVRGLREREKMQAYVSDSVLEAIQDTADAGIHAGRNLEATILFSDIRNFTGLTEENSPDKIFALLNEFLGGVEPIIRDNAGRVDKFIGDAVMAVFHHTSPEHHALSAVKAAVQMKKFVKKMNRNRTNLGLFTINIGIGISTGTVLLGDVGSMRRKDLTVIGDEVNLASRLESASKKGRHSKIIFSGATYNLIEDQVEAEEMPFTEIRGKQQAVKIFELIRLKSEGA
jgi:class 3 adenylate cyclase